MRLSKRIEKVPPYLFVGISRKIAEKKAQGVEVISFGIGDPDIPTPSPIVDTLRQALLVGHIDGSCTNAGLEKIAAVSAMSMMPRRSPRFAADRRLNLFDGAAAIRPVAEGAQIVDIGITIFQQEFAG